MEAACPGITSCPVCQTCLTSNTKMYLGGKRLKYAIQLSPSDTMKEPRILVVDDDPDIVEMISDILDMEGLSIIPAYSGTEALEKAKAENPDLILLDVMMPDIDGFEVCDKLKDDEKTAHIPIVMVTAKKDSASYLDAITVAADGYISKPFEISELVKEVKKWLQKEEGDEGGG